MFLKLTNFEKVARGWGANTGAFTYFFFENNHKQ
jgi:hypothetical protein